MTTALALVSIVILAAIYVHCLAQIVNGSRPRFRVAGLFLLSTAVGLLAAAGFAWDSVTIVLLILYAALSGPLWRRFVSRWTAGSLTTAVWTSATILSSFLVMLALVSMIVYTYDVLTLKSWKTGYWSLHPTAYISIEYIWHDEANSALEFFLYALPFGLPVNIAVGLLAGAVLGRIAYSLRSLASN